MAQVSASLRVMGTTQVTDQLPLGEPVAFFGAARPRPVILTGAHATVRPLDPAADTGALYEASHLPNGDPRIWTYLYEGPFADVGEYRRFLEHAVERDDRVWFTVIVDGEPAGVIAYLRIVPEHGSIEIGNIWFGPSLRRTAAATEAIYLLARHAFDELGYRRLEWKCNALNEASRRAADRFGFRYEGTFERHVVVKGRNRDTAWFAITDDRWPKIKTAFESWLAPSNFDSGGLQLRPLADFRQA